MRLRIRRLLFESLAESRNRAIVVFRGPSLVTRVQIGVAGVCACPERASRAIAHTAGKILDRRSGFNTSRYGSWPRFSKISPFPASYFLATIARSMASGSVGSASLRTFAPVSVTSTTSSMRTPIFSSGM